MTSRNIGNKERIARVVGGGLMIVCGLIGLAATPIGLAVAGVGAVSVLTGLVRYCPICAAGGRGPLETGSPSHADR